jgi:hypothetical protein
MVEGFALSYSADVPWGERGAPVMHVEVRGIPPSLVEGTKDKDEVIWTVVSTAAGLVASPLRGQVASLQISCQEAVKEVFGGFPANR